MKKTLLIILIFATSLLSSYSQTKKESIKELFILMHQDSLIDKSFSVMIPTLMAQMQTQAKDSASRARSQEGMKKLMTVTMPLMKDIVKKMMDEDMVAIYDYYFSENEIKDFITFYQSPSGQKLLKSTPAIQKDLMTVMFQKYLPEISKATKAKIEEMKASDKK